MSSQCTLHPRLFAVNRREPLRALIPLAALLGFALFCSRPGSTAAPADTITERLTSRPRTAPPPTLTLAVGSSIRTGAGERRRVALAGGSVLYVDQNSEVRLQAAGQLRQDAGEIFVEAGPPQDRQAFGLEVITPIRLVRASEASFGVRLEAGGARVLVTRGQAVVRRAEKETKVAAGKQLAADSDQPATAPRASHVLAWTHDLKIAAESPLIPRNAHAGGALIARDPNGNEARLSLRKYHIDVYIEDGFARTTIDQTYFNDAPWQLEGTFYFPLPADALLSRLAMYVNGVLMEGGMAERDYARQVYETIRYTRSDPALLEWLDGSTFKMRVFPLEPRQEKRIVLSYTQRLPVLYGQTTYRFPAGHTLQTVRDWSLHARVKGGADLNWASDSHTLTATKSGTDLLLDVTAKNVKFERDVVLTVAERQPAEEAVRFSTAEHGGDRYLMLRYRPKLTGAAQAGGSKHWVFLFEASGDRDPLLARVQIDLLRELLTLANPQDTFNVLSAGTRVHAQSPEALPATPDNIRSAADSLETVHLVGALDLGKALEAAAAELRKHDNAYLVHLGSGIAALGERREDVLIKMLPAEGRYVSVGVGRRWARGFMKAAAEHTRGHFTQVNPDESIAWRAFDLFATLTTPRLLDVQVKDASRRSPFLVFSQSIAQGEELCAVTRVGRGEKLPEKVIIRGTVEGETFEHVVPVKNVTKRAAYLPRLWAKLEIDRLLAEDAVRHKERILALSKAMYVMTPFTSLLVLENEDMYIQYKVDRGRQDHWAMYPCPAKIPVVVEPDPNVPGGLMNGPRTAKQAFDTILVRKTPRFIGAGTEGPPVSSYWVGLFNGHNRGEDTPRASGLTPAGILTPDLNIPITNSSFAFARRKSFLTGGEEASRESLMLRMDTSPVNRGFMTALDDNPGPIIVIGNKITHARVIRRAISISGGFPDVRQAESDLAISDLFTDGMNETAALRQVSYPTGDFAIEGIYEAPGADSKQGVLSLYQRPSYSDDASLFSNLLSYTPGMNTSLADTQAVIEAEAVQSPAVKRGAIDPEANALFAQARNAGWQALTFPEQEGQPSFTIQFDGEGRHAVDRVLPIGLRERVICDGKTLLHLYPELGVGAKRDVSRFHRLEFWQAVPWAVPLAEDLAHGVDIKMVGERTVAMVPHYEALLLKKGKSNNRAPSWVRLHLVFGGDGRLAERQLVRMPKQEVVYREILGADGVVRVLDGKGKELAVRKATLGDAAAPDLAPDTKNLLVLSLPYRTPDYVKQTLKLEKTANANLRFQDTLPLLAAYVAAGNTREAVTLFKEAFHARDQRQLGFYVLLAACGANLDGTDVDVLAEHVDEPVAQYLALHSSPVLRKHASQWAAISGQWGQGFLSHLGTSHALYQRWESDRIVKTSPTKRLAERQRALEYVRRNKGTVFGWVLLTLLEDRAEKDKEFHHALADAWPLFEDVPGLRYAARYEQARCLLKSGQLKEARERFRALYEATLKDGGLPAIDADFRVSLLRDGEGEGWNDLMRRTAARLIADKKRPAVLALAWQCWQLDDQPLANHLLAAALDNIADHKERTAMTLAGIDFLWHTGQLPQADQMLRGLLADPKLARHAALWRFGAKLAARRELADRELECLEQALEREFRQPPAVIDLNQVREEYGRLLNHYQHLVDAMVTLKIQPPAGFLARAVRAADRWRALDNDGSAACQAVARIVRKLGEPDLCWDYLTTPIALRPNEAAPWLDLAGTLSRTGDLDLADRAFAAAYAAEPTNAQILWDRAQNLRQAGKQVEALQLFRQIAQGRWQPRFQGVQTQARLQLH